MAASGLGARRAPLSMGAEEFRAAGHLLLDEIAAFLEAMPRGPVNRDETPSALRALLPAPIATPAALHKGCRVSGQGSRSNSPASTAQEEGPELRRTSSHAEQEGWRRPKPLPGRPHHRRALIQRPIGSSTGTGTTSWVSGGGF